MKRRIGEAESGRNRGLPTPSAQAVTLSRADFAQLLGE